MSFVVAPIVEGHGDVSAVPVLLRKLDPQMLVKRPVRFPRNRLLMPEYLARATRIAAANIAEAGAILLVIDADEDCAATLGPSLERQLGDVLPQFVSRVAIPVREYEAWIVGGDDSYGVIAPDSASDVKGRIRRRLGVYGETADQARLTAAIDLSLLEARSRSFRRLVAVVREFGQLASATQA